MQAAAENPREFTGRHMLVITLAFFAVIIGVNFVMAYLANSTWSGLVVANGYVASQSFNADEAVAKAQEARGWKVVLNHGTGTIMLNFADRNAAPLSGMKVTGQARRPTSERQDKMLDFGEAGQGNYSAPADLAPGLWEIVIAASESGDTVYRKTYRIVVK